MVDGVLPKGMKILDIKRKIASLWLAKFGISSSCNTEINDYNEDLEEIIDIYMEDLKFFLSNEYKNTDWTSYWSELHKIKGSIQSLNDIIDGNHIVRLIEKLRHNNFNDDFDEVYALLKDNLVEYQHKIIAYLKNKVKNNE